MVLTSNMGNKDTEGRTRHYSKTKYYKSYHAEIH